MTPSTLPPTVPSIGGPARSVFFALSLSHSSGVWHLALHAWIAAISCLRAALTARWRFSEFSPVNWGDTIKEVKDCPQPPVWVADDGSEKKKSTAQSTPGGGGGGGSQSAYLTYR